MSFDLLARLRLKDEFTSKMRKATKQLTETEKGTGRLSSGLKSLGGAMAGLGLSVGFASVAKSVVSTGITFDETMSKVQAVTGATGDDLETLRQQSKDLGKTTVFAASEAAEAQAFLGQAGFETNEILSSMPGLLDLAAAGQLELGSAADIASNIMSGFNMEAEDMGHISDVLAQAAASANTSVEQMGGGMSYVAPIASAMGIELEEVAAGIGILSDAGIQGERAGTALRGAIGALSDPTTALTKKLNEAGLSAEDVSPKMNSMADIIQNLEDAGFDASDAMELVGINAGPGLAALMSAGSEELAEFTKELQESEGAASRMAEVMSDNLGGDWKEFTSALEGVSLEIFEQAEPHLRSFLEKMTEFTSKIPDALDKFLEHWSKIREGIIFAGVAIGVFKGIMAGLKIVGTINALLKAYRSGTILATAAQWGLNTAMLANPMTWVIVGIAALIAIGVLLYRNWDTVKEKASQLWEKMKEVFGSIGEWFSDKWEQVKEVFFTTIDIISDFVAEKFEEIKGWIVDKIEEAKEMLVWVFTEMPFEVAEKLGLLVGTIVEWISKIPERFREFFNNAKDRAIDAITVLPGRIGGFLKDTYTRSKKRLKDLAESFKKWFTEAKDNALEKIKEIPGAIAGFLDEIPGKVSSAIETVWTKFKELGSAIPKAIADGFTAALGGLGKAARWAIDKAVGGMESLRNLGSGLASSFGSGYDEGTSGTSTSRYHGIDYVPSNGTKAVLHKGEAVLTAKENKERKQGGTSGGIVINMNGLTIREDADINRIADALYTKINAAAEGGA